MGVVKIQLRIIGQHKMHCGGCERSAEYLVGDIPGVQQVKADHKSQLVEVTLDPGRVTMELIQDALKDIDYLTTPVSG